MSKRLVVVGGFTTGKWALDPVCNAAVSLGLGEDADSFTFPQAMDNPDTIARAAKGQLLITHSAGILAVSREAMPERLAAYNGPEQRSKAGLVIAAGRKMGQHVSSVVTGPHRPEYARVIASNVIEGAVHPYANLRHLGSISSFSTFKRLGQCADAGIEVNAAVTEGDVFFPFNPSVAPEWLDIAVYPGGHDELLVDPTTLLHGIARQLED